MSVTVTPGGAPVTFESSNTNIATVSWSPPNLTIHGVAQGVATIRALFDDEECESKDVTVVEIQFDPADFAVCKDASKTLTVTVTPEGAPVSGHIPL